ncbi:hypothetical protein J1N35_027724 [Gossypium stocksii]|uniref:Reticulon-like protein n=1 Tax=Gossypium stocksii TaxID=47602 RepID=A0A9D3VC32_9ROSI|nr:hypothetical protein J1N35_027724 [Gossypium stocksii]
MADHKESKMEELAHKIHRKISSPSSSDSDDDKRSRACAVALKAKVYRLFGREKPLHQVLGAGKPADILLWRNKKLSAGVLGGVTSLWFLFEMLDYHLITMICHLMILALSVLFLWSNASNFINNSPPTIPEVVISEKCLLKAVSCFTFEINRTLDIVRTIATGKDLKTFLGAIAGLWFLSILGSCFNFLTMVYIVFILLYTVPVFYEKYEDKVDAFSEKMIIELKKQFAVLEKKVLSSMNKEKKKD